MKTTKGFTLIELLVVISIIGLLSSVVLASLNTARSKARDAKRMSSMRSLMVALELYRNKYGQYPDSFDCSPSLSGGGNNHYCNSSAVDDRTADGHWIKDRDGGGRTLAEFISTDPLDPNQTSIPTVSNIDNFKYFSYDGYGTGNGWYTLIFKLENPRADLEAIDGVMSTGGYCFDAGQSENGLVLTCNSSTQNNNGYINWGMGK